MAEDRMMTPADLVARAMGGEHGDLLRDAVGLVVRELMEAEVCQLIGVGRGERADGRVTNLNGYRQRAWETRVGEIDLQIPKTRSGPSYFPSFLEPRRRCEQAIVAVVMEAYVNGVSTRKVDVQSGQPGASQPTSRARPRRRREEPRRDGARR